MNDKNLMLRLTFLLNRLWSLSSMDYLSSADKAFLTGEIRKEVLRKSKRLSSSLELGFTSSLNSKTTWDFFRENTISVIVS